MARAHPHVALRVDVDQALSFAHGNRAKRRRAVAVDGARVEGSLLGRRAEREGVGAVLVIDPAAAKAEDGPAHRLDRDGAREDEQVAPGQRGAVLELERGEQVPRLIQIGVVLPRALRVEALPAALGAAAPIGDAVAATIVPSEAHKKGSVGAVVRRPDE